jgi:hypothetical protein
VCATSSVCLLPDYQRAFVALACLQTVPIYTSSTSNKWLEYSDNPVLVLELKSPTAAIRV